MKVRCICNIGKALRAYESNKLNKNEFGRFGTTEYTIFGLSLNKEYLVMGMLLGEGVLDYLIDDRGYVSAYPYPLFEVTDHRLPLSWFFKSFKHTDIHYPYIEALWGYNELVFDDSHYEKLVDCDENALRIYFRRKIELEKSLKDQLSI